MKTLLQTDFPFPGPFGEGMTDAMKDLAISIAEEPGLIWKIWTENPETNEAGGIYLFHDDASARAYLEKHRARLEAFGITEVNAKLFQVNEALTAIDDGPVGPA